MNVLQPTAPWTMRAFRPTSFRFLGTRRYPNPSKATNIPRADRGICITACRNRSRFNDSQYGIKLESNRSAVLAGLVGVGGLTLLYCHAFKEEVLRDYEFTTAYCKPNNNQDFSGCKKVNKCEDSDCLRKNECEEETIKRANTELESALRETKGKAVDFTETALKAYCDAIIRIKVFMHKAYCAAEEDNLDSPRFEDVWCDVNDALTKRCELVTLALEKGQCAWELLRRLRDIIETGKCCKYTFCNPLLVTAEETLICAEREICAKKAVFDTLLNESRVLEQYRNIIEGFRKDLKGEAESLVPSQECRVNLTDNEVTMILTHAYKKLLRVQAELKEGTSTGGDEKC